MSSNKPKIKCGEAIPEIFQMFDFIFNSFSRVGIDIRQINIFQRSNITCFISTFVNLAETALTKPIQYLKKVLEKFPSQLDSPYNRIH